MSFSTSERFVGFREGCFVCVVVDAVTSDSVEILSETCSRVRVLIEVSADFLEEKVSAPDVLSGMIADKEQQILKFTVSYLTF